MAFRDRVRRAMNKSESSSNISHTDTNTTANSESSEPAPQLEKTQSKLGRTFGFGPKDPEKAKAKAREEEEKEKKKRKKMHPSERPLTSQNLKHQQMLGQFTMNFGRKKDVSDRYSWYSGVSPMASRQNSVDDGGSISPVMTRDGRRSVAEPSVPTVPE